MRWTQAPLAILTIFAAAASARDGVPVQIELVEPATGTVVATARTAADGSFAFENVAPGRYIIRSGSAPVARAENHNSSRSNVATRVGRGWAFVDLSSGTSVSGHAGDGMAITLGPSGGSIRGRVAIKEEGLEAR